MAREYAADELPYEHEGPRLARQEHAIITLLVQLPDGSLGALKDAIDVIRRARAEGITAAGQLEDQIDGAVLLTGGFREEAVRDAD